MNNDLILTKKREWKDRKVAADAIRGVRAVLRTPQPTVDANGTEESTFSAFSLFGCLGLATLILIGGCITIRPAHAEELTDKTAALAIIGEAEGESQTCRIAIAETIRKRGSLKGVYGIRAKRVLNHKYSDKSAILARAAWLDSRYTNYSKNADGWGCAEDIKKFQCTAWFKKCAVVAKIDKTYFWKKVA